MTRHDVAVHLVRRAMRIAHGDFHQLQVLTGSVKVQLLAEDVEWDSVLRDAVDERYGLKLGGRMFLETCECAICSRPWSSSWPWYQPRWLREVCQDVRRELLTIVGEGC